MINEYLVAMGWKKRSGKWDKREILIDIATVTVGAILIVLIYYVKDV